MIVELSLFVAFTILAGSAIIKLYEWRQEVVVRRDAKRRD